MIEITIRAGHSEVEKSEMDFSYLSTIMVNYFALDNKIKQATPLMKGRKRRQTTTKFNLRIR